MRLSFAFFALFVICITLFASCNQGKSESPSSGDLSPPGQDNPFYTFEEFFGDLNGDGKEDRVTVIKNTVIDYQGEPDMNRRGIVIAFNNNGNYEQVLINQNCFSSENEHGGTYFAPELSIKIERGNLYIAYDHGKYGSHRYTFRYRNGDFELIGYDKTEFRSSEEMDWILTTITSINFNTKRKQIKTDIAPGKVEETWEDIVITKLVKLSDIADFDEFNPSLFFERYFSHGDKL